MWTYMDDDISEELGYNNLYNVFADSCLDLTGGKAIPRAPVNLFECNPRDPQWWEVPRSINKDKHDCTGSIKHENKGFFDRTQWCLDADTPTKPLNHVILFECEETSQAQQWTMKYTGVLDDKSRLYTFYLVIDPSSKKLKGLSPPEKPS